MKNLKKILIRLFPVFAAAAVFLACGFSPLRNAQASELSEGEYSLSGELSAYLAAMGGVEFGESLLTGVTLVVDETGAEYLKLYLTKSSVTIYSITCDTFVDATPSTVTTTRGIEDGTIGIYDANGNIVTEGVQYTLSEDTALNSADVEVNYVDSITYPISSREETYNLALYINSNVMGVEFCNENDEATETTYAATLTVDWLGLEAEENGAAEEESEEETQEENEEESLEANEELEGLAIYAAGDEDAEEDEEDEAAVEEAADTAAKESSSSVLVPVIIICAVVVIAAVIIIVVIEGKKKKSAAAEAAGTDEGKDEEK